MAYDFLEGGAVKRKRCAVGKRRVAGRCKTKKRPLNAFAKFVKKHMRPGLTLADLAKRYHRM